MLKKVYDMRKLLFHTCGILLLFVSGCGFHTQADVDLAYAISEYTVKQELIIKKAVAQKPLTTQEAEEWVKDAEALTATTKTLAELLGDPSKPVIKEDTKND